MAAGTKMRTAFVHATQPTGSTPLRTVNKSRAFSAELMFAYGKSLRVCYTCCEGAQADEHCHGEAASWPPSRQPTLTYRGQHRPRMYDFAYQLGANSTLASNGTVVNGTANSTTTSLPPPPPPPHPFVAPPPLPAEELPDCIDCGGSTRSVSDQSVLVRCGALRNNICLEPCQPA